LLRRNKKITGADFIWDRPEHTKKSAASLPPMSLVSAVRPTPSLKFAAPANKRFAGAKARKALGMRMKESA
jgi:hypothetical protein